MNTLFLTRNEYSEEIKNSGLLKEHREFLKELIICFLSKETPPAITKSSFDNFTSHLPIIVLDGEQIQVKLIDTDTLRISLNWHNSENSPFIFHKKNKNQLFNAGKNRRRIQSYSFSKIR